jgi:general secretion pathway protein M
MSTPFVADPRRSRSLALGILVAVVVAVALVIAVPVWMLNRHYDVALAENLDKLDRYRRIAGTRTQVVRQLEAMAARDPRKYFLRGGAPALAGAEEQEAIRSLVDSSGGRLITMGAPASKDDGRYRQVSVNVQLTANIFALRKILSTIENNTPYLFVDNLSIRSQSAANYKPPPGVEPEMFVQFDVVGYALTGSR